MEKLQFKVQKVNLLLKECQNDLVHLLNNPNSDKVDKAYFRRSLRRVKLSLSELEEVHFDMVVLDR